MSSQILIPNFFPFYLHFQLFAPIGCVAGGTNSGPCTNAIGRESFKSCDNDSWPSRPCGGRSVAASVSGSSGRTVPRRNCRASTTTSRTPTCTSSRKSKYPRFVVDDGLAGCWTFRQEVRLAASNRSKLIAVSCFLRSYVLIDVSYFSSYFSSPPTPFGVWQFRNVSTARVCVYFSFLEQFRCLR